jgi:hypothetical protein
LMYCWAINFPQNFITTNHRHFSHGICESATWEWLCWILLAHGFSQGSSRISNQGCIFQGSTKKTHFQVHSCDCWQASVPQDSWWNINSLGHRAVHNMAARFNQTEQRRVPNAEAMLFL